MNLDSILRSRRETCFQHEKPGSLDRPASHLLPVGMGLQLDRPSLRERALGSVPAEA